MTKFVSNFGVFSRHRITGIVLLLLVISKSPQIPAAAHHGCCLGDSDSVQGAYHLSLHCQCMIAVKKNNSVLKIHVQDYIYARP